MGKNTGLIYRSFVEAARLLDDKSQLEAMNAYFDYLLDGIPYEGDNAVVMALMLMAMPVVDKAQENYQTRVENGKKGGRPKKQNESVENLNETEKNLNETENNRMKTEPKAEETLDIDIDKDIYKDIDKDIDTDVKSAPACACLIPSHISDEIKKRVILDGDVSDLNNSTWIQPAKLVQDKNNIYICSRQERAAVHLRDHYGGYFKDAIRAVNPDFSGDVIFAIA